MNCYYHMTGRYGQPRTPWSRANGTVEERPMEKTHHAVLAKAKAEQILLLLKGETQ